MFLPLLLLASVMIRFGDDSAETIDYMKAKSEVIVVATISNDISSSGSAPISNSLYSRPYQFTAKINILLKGSVATDKSILVSARRIERTNDPFSLKEGDKVILFLAKPSGDQSQYGTADSWFGVSPYTEGLEAALAGKLDFTTN